MILQLSRSVAVAALLVSFCHVSGLSQDPSAQASLSVQGRATAYGSVVALRGKAHSEPCIVVIATVKPLTKKKRLRDG